MKNSGKLGKPKFQLDDRVRFKIFEQGKEQPTILTGSIYIIDKYGTFEQHEEPSYDIFVDYYLPGGCLFKHIRESLCESAGNE